MKRQICQQSIVAVEEVSGISPEEALRAARAEPESSARRVYAADYLPAMEAMVAKGWSCEAAAKRLHELGCPFAWRTLDATFRSQGKNYAARPQAKKRSFQGGG